MTGRLKLKKFKDSLIALLLIPLLYSTACSKVDTDRTDNRDYTGAVSTAHKLATEAGIDILKRGGNAIDASVGIGFVLAVVYPQAGNIGGGGFMVIHFNNGNNTSIDYREKSPLLTYRDMFLDESGNIAEGLSTVGHLAAGVPGSVAGMLFALEKYGSMDRKEILQYAIDIADTGFVVEDQLAKAIDSYSSDFSRFPGSAKAFGNIKAGDRFVQKDLAETLRRISENGRDGFYKGVTADLIVNEMKNGNGIISYKDLEDYEAKERSTVVGTYKGYQIISMGPPSSGGISLIYLLNILENYDLRSMGFASISSIQLMTEAMRRVYADRSEFMGDMDFVNVPWDILTSKVYAERRMQDYSADASSTSVNTGPGDAYYRESDQTTHYSVADASGNLVSVTTTINDVFGNRLVVDGAGFLLNNEMDDFSAKPGVPNIYGLVGSTANAIEPGKRMLSSMTPTIILKNGKPFMITGSPGGGRIITTVLQAFLNIAEHGMSIEEAIDAPRFHHQWLPDEIQMEKDFADEDVRNGLKLMGYKIKDISAFGRVDAILFDDNGKPHAHSDRRGYGSAMTY